MGSWSKSAMTNGSCPRELKLPSQKGNRSIPAFTPARASRVSAPSTVVQWTSEWINTTANSTAAKVLWRRRDRDSFVKHFYVSLLDLGFLLLFDYDSNLEGGVTTQFKDEETEARENDVQLRPGVKGRGLESHLTWAQGHSQSALQWVPDD